jgi:hypothetical protein
VTIFQLNFCSADDAGSYASFELLLQAQSTTAKKIKQAVGNPRRLNNLSMEILYR